MKSVWLKNARTPAMVPPLFATRGSIERMPIVTLTPNKVNSDHFVILLSGDGGWADFTQSLANEYVKRGIPVVGLNSLLYFWNKKSPEEVARDIQDIAEFHQKKWGMKKFDLVGFSFGASVIPILAGHVKPEFRQNIRQTAILAPGMNAKLEFEISDWLADADSGDPIADQISHLDGWNFKCIQAKNDIPSVCLKFDSRFGQSFVLEGDHHFNYDLDQFKGILY